MLDPLHILLLLIGSPKQPPSFPRGTGACLWVAVFSSLPAHGIIQTSPSPSPMGTRGHSALLPLQSLSPQPLAIQALPGAAPTLPCMVCGGYMKSINCHWPHLCCVGACVLSHPCNPQVGIPPLQVEWRGGDLNRQNPLLNLGGADIKGENIYNSHSGQAIPSHPPCPVHPVKSKGFNFIGTSSATPSERFSLSKLHACLSNGVDWCMITECDFSPWQLKSSQVGAVGSLGMRMCKTSWVLWAKDKTGWGAPSPCQVTRRTAWAPESDNTHVLCWAGK